MGLFDLFKKKEPELKDSTDVLPVVTSSSFEPEDMLINATLAKKLYKESLLTTGYFDVDEASESVRLFAEAMRNEGESIRDQIESAKEDMAYAKDQLASKKSDVALKKKELASIRKSVDSEEAEEFKETASELEILQEELEELEDEVEAGKQEVADQQKYGAEFRKDKRRFLVEHLNLEFHGSTSGKSKKQYLVSD